MGVQTWIPTTWIIVVPYAVIASLFLCQSYILFQKRK